MDIEKFDGSNWPTSKFQMKRLLMAKEVWNHGEGTVEQPEETDAQAKDEKTLMVGCSVTGLGDCCLCRRAYLFGEVGSVPVFELRGHGFDLRPGQFFLCSTKYEKTKQKAMTTLVMGIHSSLIFLVTSCSTPHGVWETLKTQLEINTLANKLFLKR